MRQKHEKQLAEVTRLESSTITTTTTTTTNDNNNNNNNNNNNSGGSLEKMQIKHNEIQEKLQK